MSAQTKSSSSLKWLGLASFAHGNNRLLVDLQTRKFNLKPQVVGAIGVDQRLSEANFAVFIES